MAASKPSRGDNTMSKHLSLNPEKQKEFEAKVKAVKKKGDDASLDPGVVYLGHIPHGFYESEMKSFFSQFGRIKKLRLARSKKTGASKGYAFIEFNSEDVAKIVAETMNNYLMFEKLLKCQFVEKSKLHEATFKGCYRRFQRPKANLVGKRRHNAVVSQAKEKTRMTKFMKKQKKRIDKLSAMGINIKLEDVTIVKKVPNENSGEMSTPVIKDVNSKSETDVPKATPETVRTPKGDLHVLKEDISDEEISFKTPPNSVKSSKLRRTVSGSLLLKENTPKTTPGKRMKRTKLPVDKSSSVSSLRKTRSAADISSVSLLKKSKLKTTKRLKK